MPKVQTLSLYEFDSHFFIIGQENIGIRKKHAIKHTVYKITPYICAVKHNCKANMLKRLFKRYIDLLGFQPWTIWVYRMW